MGKHKKLQRKSQQHVETVLILRRLFPDSRVLQDSPIKVGNKTLFLDIYLPKYNLAFEVNGRQHYEYNEFMYKNRAEFRRQQENDILKEHYCVNNNIRLIKIKYDVEITQQIILELIEKAK